MIQIQNITIKNFLSIGNQTQAISFDDHSLTLIMGENLDLGGEDSGSKNGVGKTSLINAISYGLYGQALTNIKKGNLINKTNGKNMLITITFIVNKIKYHIVRGRSPNILKFFVNDTEQKIEDESQGDSRETQKKIIDILGMTHEMFKHIVSLNTYTIPFLSMRAQEQRDIIEQLLGITLLSEKALLLKEQIKVVKEDINKESIKIETIKSSNEKITQSIEQTQKRKEQWIIKQQNDLKNLQNSLDTLEKLNINEEIENHTNLNIWNEQSQLKNQLNQKLNNANREKNNYEKSIKEQEENIKELKNAICFTCGQNIEKIKKEELILEINEKINEYNNKLTEINDDINKISQNILDIGDLGEKPKTFYDDIKDAYQHLNNIEYTKQLIESNKQQKDPYQSQIDDLKNTAIQKIDWSNVNLLNELKEHQEFLLKLLTNKDSFVRKKIIDQNLNFLNARLSFYLNKIGLPHEVVFQNDLNVEISMLGQDLDFDNLSRGERNRLILALSWSFRDVWESLYQKINIMFIDELIDSGMDPAGVDNSLIILKQMAREANRSIFIISHREELIGRVENILKVIKSNGFTSYEQN